MKIKAVVFGNVALPATEGQKNDWNWFSDRKIALYALTGSALPTDAPIQEVADQEALKHVLEENNISPRQVLFVHGSDEKGLFARQKSFHTIFPCALDRIARAINQIEYTVNS